MAVDVLDPGPDGNYPYWPRDAEGVPRPIGSVHHIRRDGERIKVDTRVRIHNGDLLPPVIPPGPVYTEGWESPQ